MQVDKVEVLVAEAYICVYTKANLKYLPPLQADSPPQEVPHSRSVICPRHVPP